MVSFPKYENYKDSCVEWLGDIPSHWAVNKLKNTLKTTFNGVWGKDPDEQENTVVCIRVADFTRHNFRISTDNLTRRKVSKSDFQSRHLRYGDLLLEKSGGGDKQLVGQVVVYEHDFPAVCSNFLMSLRIKDCCNNYFLNYVFACLYSLKINYRHIKQTTGIQNIDSDSYFSELFACPPIEEQDKIVEFLDRKTAEIDQAIKQKQRLIKLLKEQKAILIDRAVTKGLNPNVPMRDSGVDWIGEIPKHWSIAKIKHIAKFVSGGTPKKEKPEFWGGDIPWVSAKEMKQRYIDDTEDKITQKALQKTTLKLLEIDTIIVVVRGMILARKIPVALSRTPVTINQDMKALIVERQTCIPEYLLLLLEGINHHLPILLEEAGHGTKTLPTEGLSNFELPIPPRSEQLEIIVLSQKKGIEIDSFINIANQQILLLGNLKQIIISEAVTGKMKI